MRFIIGGVALWMLAGCARTTVQVTSLPPQQNGWRVEGCDTTWFCQGINGPCEQRSCEDWEMVTYNKCIEHASRGGLSLGSSSTG